MLRHTRSNLCFQLIALRGTIYGGVPAPIVRYIAPAAQEEVPTIDNRVRCPSYWLKRSKLASERRRM
ncbi:MAG: hypothetical protein OJF49_003866 [Ktedonobacterales bacterium]|nr:MAG: hypothetical protein OJF49_003866 [Ktedonobacterales bacterium]